MKVIDLLNKIANGEEVPEHINYTHRVFGKDTMFVCKENIINKLDIGAIELNDEVEIIEEDKKIEKITNMNCIDAIDSNCYEKYSNKAIALDINTLRHQINKIIDYINKESK